jgi:hypothetical protein
MGVLNLPMLNYFQIINHSSFHSMAGSGMCIPVDISYTTKGLHQKVHVTGSHLVLSSIPAGGSAQVYSTLSTIFQSYHDGQFY